MFLHIKHLTQNMNKDYCQHFRKNGRRLFAYRSFYSKDEKMIFDISKVIKDVFCILSILSKR